ncbi:hypothetical protein ACFQH6_13585 [Halobacteriaceae archaeon GCM10025711]
MSDEIGAGDSSERPDERTRPPWPDRADTSLSLDAAFDVLSDRRRRFVLHYLMDEPDEPVTTDELVDKVLEWEADDDRGDDYRQRVTVNLHHVHLPKLADANVVDYDPRSETVRYWGQPVVEEYAEHVAQADLQGR